MKKFLFFVGTLLLSVSFTSASSCIDLQNNLTKGKETNDVTVLQNFLMQKGLLMVTPNGYFGPSTLRAVKDYQESIGLSNTGAVYNLTREAIKKETCTNQTPSSNTISKNINTSVSTANVSNTKTKSCVDFKDNIITGNENENVLSLQNFLMQKGLLMVTPNGYFGPSTLRAVKDYQESIGLSNTGAVYNLTREAIKKETCDMVSTNNITKTNSQQIVVASSTKPVVVATTTIVAVTPNVILTNNQKRQQNVIDILGATYNFYLDSRGTFPIPYVSTTTIEICTLGISLCTGFNELKSSLVPRFLSKIPSDPSINNPNNATSSGYFIKRDANGDITVTAPKADSKANIFATCNFYAGCKIKTQDNTFLILGKPYIDSIDKVVFLSGGIMSLPLVIHGKEFSSSSNMVTVTPQGGGRTYTLGTFKSVDGITISASSSFTYTPISCGVNCSELLPAGGYNLTVKTEAGESNVGFISVKGITSTSLSNGNDTSFRPKTTHMKLGTVTLSSPTLVTLKSLSFGLHGTTTLVNKVSNFTITDATTGKITNSGPTFSLADETLSDYKTKIYELYADIAEIDNSYAGRIEITGTSTVKEFMSNSLVYVPIPKFIISISY